MPMRSWLKFVMMTEIQISICFRQEGLGREHTFESLVLLSNQILHRDFDVFECDVCCSTRPNSLAIHLTCRHTTHTTLDE